MSKAVPVIKEVELLANLPLVCPSCGLFLEWEEWDSMDRSVRRCRPCGRAFIVNTLIAAKEIVECPKA